MGWVDVYGVCIGGVGDGVIFIYLSHKLIALYIYWGNATLTISLPELTGSGPGIQYGLSTPRYTQVVII